ncbi:MAG: hypothetical protein KA099_08105 [Alphaproteobacteria bacterium]|nr:hypothetical protein [Alphaproteobacteria bacterium]MBP7757846.1 hypothetical protein [Alphaproteobacteria bacterium]MBP7760954.1 hypothetical protein [Alphaproteobacteria bacterium]MBP7905272.1 hypothetical protein [Alphaproteobacteria bacterium]
MFGFFLKGFSKYDKRDQLAGEELYLATIRQARLAEFFTRYGVPDSVDGRFDLLMVHLYMLFCRLRPHPRYKDISQYIFDRAFKDMEKGLREVGVGDVGIPKKMKVMMQAFNGRMNAYKATEAHEHENASAPPTPDQPLFDTLRRNLYGTVEKPKNSMIADMVIYMRYNAMALNHQDMDQIALGNIKYVNPSEIRKP